MRMGGGPHNIVVSEVERRCLAKGLAVEGLYVVVWHIESPCVELIVRLIVSNSRSARTTARPIMRPIVRPPVRKKYPAIDEEVKKSLPLVVLLGLSLDPSLSAHECLNTT